ncbi:ABC transporter permease [Corynebacterium urealyticum]|uniref:ABC transporter permease n=1 Tax=Corynebacterium urealyticum TaxID=43771 RepID=A0A5D4FXM9_9CORY|nr:ABC transporter permease [Corynebacterium urealyticum]TYR20857.1 ABC transporter permease [Corynebacterium urealyticum]
MPKRTKGVRVSGAAAVGRLSLRTIAAHKVRLLLTVLAVVLGTAFIAGSLMFTAGLSRTFDSLVDGEMKNVDAVVSASPSPHGGTSDGGDAQPTGTQPRNSGDTPGAAGEGQGIREMPEATGAPADRAAAQPQAVSSRRISEDDLRRIQEMPQVSQVNIANQVQAVAARENGETLNSAPAPTMLQPFYDGEESVKGETHIVDGAAPTDTGDVAINASAAEAHGVKVGDRLKVVTSRAQDEVTVTGIYDSDIETGGFIGLSVAADTFKEKFLQSGEPRTLYVGAAQGTTAAELVDSLAAEFPYSVQTGEEVSEELSAEISKALSFVSYFLVAFGLVGLLVGTFIIANTFSMIVAQRMREFALLRALGVSRGQLTASVVLEAVVVGVLGSALGVLAGMGLVKVIYAVLESTGAGLPAGGIVLTPLAVALPMIVGVLVTILSAWAPARSAGATRPVEAMRSGDASSSSSLVGRTIAGGLALTVGVAVALAGALGDGWSTKTRAILVGAAAVLVILGTFLASPAVARRAVPAIGRIVGLPFGTVGALARKNSARNPRRTATTAFALTLGLALVGAVGMLGASMKASVAEVTETAVKADFVATGPSNSGFPVPNGAVDAVQETPGVGAVGVLGSSLVNIEGIGAFAGQPFANYYGGNPHDGIVVDTVEGTTDLAEEGFIADTKTAASHGWKVGESYPVHLGKTPAGKKLPLLGTYEPNQALGPYVLSRAGVEGVQPSAQGQWPGQIMALMVTAAPGEGGGEQSVPTELQEELREATRDYIVVQVLTPAEASGEAAVMVDQMLNILYALLALAIIVAILGIVNTLALNVIERRQEIGMLRAIGTMRGQIRRMITLKAVQIAVYGAIVGVLIGLGLGWAFVTVLAGEGLEELAVPWLQLVLMLLGSALVGVVAAAWPAIKAGRTPPLEAIAD